MIFADIGLPEIPTSAFGLLSLMVVLILVGIGWFGRVFFSELRWAIRRLLGEGGLIDEQNKAMASTAKGMESVANCVKQHDERVNETVQRHAEACEESGGRVKSMHSAALMACDEVEKILTEHGIACTDRIQRIRLELQREI